MELVGVLDDGYVCLHDTLGSDLSVVNAARASYNKRSKKLKKRDRRLIKFLGNHKHESPFRHAYLQFEVRAPLMVCRQWWKYVVGCSHTPGSDVTDSFLDAFLGNDGEGTSWNETSGRYVTQEWKFYHPSAWREAPENSKQGSGAPLTGTAHYVIDEMWRKAVVEGLRNYEKALEYGLCPEQARLFLPYCGLYVNWYWTASLQAVAHFVRQRHPGFDGSHAQVEIQEYAKAIHQLVQPLFPVSFKALVGECDG